MPRDPKHIPVLLGQVLDVLNPRPGQTLVDCTLGLAGHSSALLTRIAPTGTLISIDFDPANIALATPRLEAVRAHVGGTYHIAHNNFAALPTVLQQLGIPRVDGVLADVGVASTQIDDPDRGFSYRHPGPLDMRMDPTRGEPAHKLLARLSEAELAHLFLTYGDETDAPQIAALIVERRKLQPILTTEQLTRIVCDARDFTLARAAGAKLHPAARTFQALRIATNRELANLERLLRVLPDVLAPGGVAALISFHSGEDRLVKDAFRAHHRAGTYTHISPDPLTATDKEIRANPRSRSAKLRWARRAS